MSYRDPYEVLGIPDTISKREFKERCADLLSQFHPDKNKNNAQILEKYTEIRTAIDQILTHMKTGAPIQRQPKDFIGLKKYKQEDCVFKNPADFLNIKSLHSNSLNVNVNVNVNSFDSTLNELFNEKFVNNTDDKDYTFSNKVDTKYEDAKFTRSNEELRNERARQDAEFSKEVPNIFNNNLPFNNDVFQSLYEQSNKKELNGVISIDKLEQFDPNMSSGLGRYSNIDNNLNINNKNISYDSAFNGSQHTTKIDLVAYEKFKSSQITTPILTTTDRRNIKNKLNEYQLWKPEALDPNAGLPSQEVIKKPSTSEVNNMLFDINKRFH